MENITEKENPDEIKKKFINYNVFEIEKILNFQMPKIKITNIPKNNIENSKGFKLLLIYFNKACGTKIDIEDLLYSKSNFRMFYDFIVHNIIKGSLEIPKTENKNFMLSLQSLRNKYTQNLRSIEKYYDEIVRTIFYPKGLTKKEKIVQHEMYLFDQAYSLMKLAFKDEKRENNERYFEHLKGVMEILLRELPNPNLNKILIGLLHDIEEDIPEYSDVIKKIYGEYISTGVSILSKKDRKEYLTDDEFFEYNTTKELYVKSNLEKEGKNRRNKHYFGHLDNLNDDYLDVKLADRIHNLRDSDTLKIEKINRKIKETEQYFLDVAKKRNPTAYKLIIQEIEKLKLKLI